MLSAYVLRKEKSMTIHPKKYTYKNFIDTIDFSEIQKKTMESMNIQLQQLTVTYSDIEYQSFLLH